MYTQNVRTAAGNVAGSYLQTYSLHDVSSTLGKMQEIWRYFMNCRMSRNF